MTAGQSEFLEVLKNRGFVHQISDEEGLDEQLKSGTTGAYIGFDATANSLHVGSMTQIMMLYWLQQTGHKPIVLMGGGTSMIGDPSGKDEARQLMNAETIEKNKNDIKKCFESFLKFGDGASDAVMVDNAEWLLELNYVDFLRDYGRYLSVNAMLGRDSVKNRLEREQHLSFLEFNYMCLQAYDFVELARRFDCRLQLGGSDQWGNIVSGVELGRRVDTAQLFGLTTPLLETASGAKMGKTADGAIWLNPDRLEPFDFWQYWRNVQDDDVTRFLKLFTPLELDEIEKLGELEGQELNEAKKILANEVTKLVHGQEQAEKADRAAQQTFVNKEDSDNLPVVNVSGKEMKDGMGALQFIVAVGLAKSNGEARRHIDGGAIRINDEAISDGATVIDEKYCNENGHIKISFGKKRHILVNPKA